jgi:hypothetical protein
MLNLFKLLFLSLFDFMTLITEIIEEYNVIKDKLYFVEPQKTEKILQFLKMRKSSFEALLKEADFVLQFIDDEIKTLDEKLICFPLEKYIKPQMESQSALTLPFNEIEEFQKNFPYPPNNLMDKKMNSEILPFLTPELFVYFRYIIHPYKLILSDADMVYLSNLIDVEEWQKEWIDYLIAPAIFTKLEINDYLSEENTKQIETIESYLKELREQISDDHSRIIVSLKEEELSVQIHLKAILIKKEVSKEFYTDMMKQWGFLYDLDMTRKEKNKEN